MNTLALITLIGPPAANLVIWLVIVALVIWLIFFVLPLPPPVRTILAVAVAVLLLLMLFTGCAVSYERGGSKFSVSANPDPKQITAFQASVMRSF